jgi:hypothetical protein
MCAITAKFELQTQLGCREGKKRQTTRGKICFGGQMDMVNC